MSFGSVVWLDATDSTSRSLKERALDGAPEGVSVAAREQTGGYGRRGRKWCSPRGGLWVSTLLRPTERCVEIQLLAALVVCELLEELGLKPGIRWPNDVLLGDRKVAGLLAETRWRDQRPQFTVLGLGLNVNNALSDYPPELRPVLTTVCLELGAEVALETLLKNYLDRLQACYQLWKSHGLTGLLPHYERRLVSNGRGLYLDLGERLVSTVAVGLDALGGLVCADGQTYYSVERVWFVGQEPPPLD